MTDGADPDYCEARMPDGGMATGWIIRNQSGDPVYFQIEGRAGFSVPYEKMRDVKPISKSK